MKRYKTKLLALLLFLVQAHSSLAVLFNFEEGGEGSVGYSLNDTSRYKKSVLTSTIQTLENTGIRVSVSYEDDTYKIHNLENKKQDKDSKNVFSLIINSPKAVQLGDNLLSDISDFKFEKFHLVGTSPDNFTTYFINYWNFTVLPLNNPIFRKICFWNEATIVFEKDIIFPLVSSSPQYNSFFHNYGTSIFKGNLRFFEGSPTSNASFELQGDYENNLQNYGTISCAQNIFLTGRIFMGEMGTIKSSTGIYYQYKQGRTRGIHSIQRDIDFPISIITRIPKDIMGQRFKLPSGELSELCALHFYQNYTAPVVQTFRYKANASENGIDVWAYTDTNVTLHESKNYQANGYQLDNNQMTKKWCLGHLLKAFQDLIKDQYYRQQAGEEGRIIENEIRAHLQNALCIIVKEPYKPLLTDALNAAYKYPLDKVLDLKAEDEFLEDINKIFDFTPIIGQGNSIYQIPLSINTPDPLASKMGSPSIPTYYFGRNLYKRIMEEGSFRKKKKVKVDKK